MRDPVTLVGSLCLSQSIHTRSFITHCLHCETELVDPLFKDFTVTLIARSSFADQCLECVVCVELERAQCPARKVAYCGSLQAKNPTVYADCAHDNDVLVRVREMPIEPTSLPFLCRLKVPTAFWQCLRCLRALLYVSDKLCHAPVVV